MADKKVIAVTVIHRTLEPGKPGDTSKGIKAVPPKIQVVQPKTVFMVSTDDRKGYAQSEYDELKGMGAIRDPGKDEKVQVDVENMVADGETRTTTKKTTTTASGSGSTGSGSTAGKAGTKSGEGKQSGDATGAKAGEGAGDSGNDNLV